MPTAGLFKKPEARLSGGEFLRRQVLTNYLMKKLFITMCLAMITIASFAQKSKYVVMISIDGLRPEFYKDHSWPAPNIQALARNGVYADGVRGVFPTVTYPSHTTILTGALPAKHGIYYNTPFEPEGQTGNWYWEESLIKVATLWDACKQKRSKQPMYIGRYQ